MKRLLRLLGIRREHTPNVPKPIEEEPQENIDEKRKKIAEKLEKARQMLEQAKKIYGGITPFNLPEEVSNKLYECIERGYLIRSNISEQDLKIPLLEPDFLPRKGSIAKELLLKPGEAVIEMRIAGHLCLYYILPDLEVAKNATFYLPRLSYTTPC